MPGNGWGYLILGHTKESVDQYRGLRTSEKNSLMRDTGLQDKCLKRKGQWRVPSSRILAGPLHPLLASDQGRGDFVPKAKPGIKRHLSRFNGLGPESSVTSAKLAYEQFGLGTVML